MRYTQDHKEETHKSLLKAAAAQLREKGPDRLSVTSVMKAAASVFILSPIIRPWPRTLSNTSG